MSSNGDKSLIAIMADKAMIEPTAYLNTVKSMCFGGKPASNEEMAALLMVSNKYGLDPITREVMPFRDKRGSMQIVVGIDGWLKLAHSHPQFDGMELTDNVGEDGKPISCTCTIWRKDQSHPITITEWFVECYRDTQPWRERPIRMLRHKCAKECIRYAFGYAGIMDPEEAREIRANGEHVIEYQEGAGHCNPHKIREALKMMGSTENEFRELAEIKLGKSTIEACTKAEAESVLEEINKSMIDADFVPEDESKLAEVLEGEQEELPL